MFCPRCGTTQNDDWKFCKACGANLQAVRQVVDARETSEKFDWSRTWVAEMFMSSEEAVRQQAMLDRLQGKTPETRRRNEIKAGVITASVGVALMIVLFVIMNGIILGGGVSDRAAQILARLWIAGVIPLMVGAALIINGVFISKRGDESAPIEAETVPSELNTNEPVEYLSPADTSELFPAGFSVTDETTKHLKQPSEKGRSS